jgi:hypothetical protein
MGAENYSPANTKQPEKTSAELLQHSEKDGNAFLSIIISSDETWIHHYYPLTKKPMESSVTPRRKKFKVQVSVG